MRSLLSCLLMVTFLGSPEQGSQSNAQSNTSGVEGQAALVDKMLSENPDFASALSKRLINNPSFVGSMGQELWKSRPDHQPNRWALSPWEDIEPRPPSFRDGNGFEFPFIACDSNTDLSELIKQLADEPFLASVMSYETTHKMNSMQIHQYRLKTITILVTRLRARAEAAR
jgi:hypothetical protein